MTVEDVERLMDDNAEAIAYQEEIGQILSQQGVMEDEDLLAELDQMDELDALEVDDRMPQVPKEQFPNTQNYLNPENKETNAERAVVLEN